MKTMTLDEAIENLERFRDKYGNVEVVLWDMETGCYFPLWEKCFEAQKMEGCTVRVSVGIEWDTIDDMLVGPEKRPL